MNAEQAEKCIEMASAAIGEKDWARAERLLIKSIKLHETPRA
jgi:hypothetical protein